MTFIRLQFLKMDLLHQIKDSPFPHIITSSAGTIPDTRSACFQTGELVSILGHTYVHALSIAFIQLIRQKHRKYIKSPIGKRDIQMTTGSTPCTAVYVLPCSKVSSLYPTYLATYQVQDYRLPFPKSLKVLFEINGSIVHSVLKKNKTHVHALQFTLYD